LGAGSADLLADLDQFGDQLAQALALGNLGARLLQRLAGHHAGAGLAADAIGQQPLGVPAGPLLGAVAGGLAAGAIALGQRAGAQVTEGGDLVEHLLALGFQCVEGGGCRHQDTSSESLKDFQNGRNFSLRSQGLQGSTSRKSQS